MDLLLKLSSLVLPVVRPNTSRQCCKLFGDRGHRTSSHDEPHCPADTAPGRAADNAKAAAAMQAAADAAATAAEDPRILRTVLLAAAAPANALAQTIPQDTVLPHRRGGRPTRRANPTKSQATQNPEVLRHTSANSHRHQHSQTASVDLAASNTRNLKINPNL